MNKYLEETALLDYSHSEIREFVGKREWKGLDEGDRIGKVYLFVRDEILFGYNRSDDVRASEVLEEEYGQCNTKATLLMALLRAVGISCRFHGFTIDKKLQKGAITGIWYKLAPKNIIHSWVEVSYDGKWCNLEGVILDKKYLVKLQAKFGNSKGNFCGYGVCVEDFESPKIDWNGGDTYIQKEGINQDFGGVDNEL